MSSEALHGCRRRRRDAARTRARRRARALLGDGPPGVPAAHAELLPRLRGRRVLPRAALEETGEARFLTAARAGAEHLLAITDTGGDACRVYHHEPDGLDLHCLGWCHGPVGTARLFFVLHRITGEEASWTWARRPARAIAGDGRTAQREVNLTGQSERKLKLRLK